MQGGLTYSGIGVGVIIYSYWIEVVSCNYVIVVLMRISKDMKESWDLDMILSRLVFPLLMRISKDIEKSYFHKSNKKKPYFS